MLVNLYPYAIALNGIDYSQPSYGEAFNNDGTLKLSEDGHEYSYYLSNGTIYDSSNNAVPDVSRVDGYFNVYNEDGDYVSNLFFEDSPYYPLPIGYLYLTSSTDGGASWSEPLLIRNVKSGSEQVCLASPGRGTVLSDGTIIFPVYSYAEGSQECGFIYSTDGVNWNRSNSGITNGSSESAIVELNASTLRVFYRNKTTKICYVDVTKNGNAYSWGSPVQTSVSCNSNTQLSAIKVTEGGKDYILVSNPSNISIESTAAARTNGQIVTFKASDMSVVKTTSVASVHSTNTFMDSCLSQLSNSDIAILYEDQENAWGVGDNCYDQMSYKTFTLEELGVKNSSETSTEPPSVTPVVDDKEQVSERIDIKLTVGETSEELTVSETTSYGSKSETTEDGVASYIITGTEEQDGEYIYSEPSRLSSGALGATSTTYTKTKYYYYVDGNYYPVYAKYYSDYYPTYFYVGYSTSDSASDVTQIGLSYKYMTTSVDVCTRTQQAGITASTKIRFVGISEGTTSVTVGSTTYVVTVSANTADIPTVLTTTPSVNEEPSQELAITEQPVSINAILKDKISFSVKADNAASYQWQYSKNGKSWNKSSAKGATTDTLSITVSNTNATNLYRCKITGIDGSVIYSDVVQVLILKAAKITSQPVSVNAKAGDKVSFTVSAENVTSFQWYYSKDGGKKWYASTATGAKTQTLSLKASSSNINTVYRCKITGDDEKVIYTNTVGIKG